ncbi:MAG: glycosyltransferase family 4 protein [Chitinophagaceae bacterium]
MTKFLFVGTFLSKKTGTQHVVEMIRPYFENKGLELYLASSFQNKILRLAHILFSILFYRGQKVFFSVFSGQAFTITKWGSAIAQWRNKEIIFTLHGGALPEFTEKNKKMVLDVFKKAHLIQTPSLHLKKYFEPYGFDIDYIPNPIFLDNFQYSRNHVKPHTLLWVRAFTKIYNPMLAIRTLNEVKKQYPETTLTMIGPDKGLLPEVKKEIEKLGLKNSITITGPIKNEKLHTYFQTHEIYLNTTSFESFGKAVVEAASCGIPIVSTSVGEIPLIWTDNENIILVKSFDEKEMASKVISLFANKELAMTISKNARKKAESFSWNIIVPRWEELLQDN